MCENIKIEERNDKVQTFIDSLSKGIYSILYKRITSVKIKDIRILSAFNHFIKNVDCGKSFSLAELSRTTDSLLSNAKISENAGNKIFMYDPTSISDAKVFEKLLRFSVTNLFNLFSLNNGIIFSTEILSEKIEILETKRFLIVSPKKAVKLARYCEDNTVKITCVGEFSSENNLVFNENGAISSFNKALFSNDFEENSLELTVAHFESFMSGYNAVASLLLLDTVSDNNVLRLGLDGDLASVFARFLGFYVGVNDFKPKTYRFIYTHEPKFGVSVSKPSVSDGDYLYLLRVHNNQFEMTDRVHLNQLYNYLKEKQKSAIIKYALPYSKGVESTLEKIAPEGIEYLPFEYPENDKFSIIACVGRGESLNGLKIGYFKNVE